MKICPDQLDANYFRADFLAYENQYELALLHLNKATKAPRLEGRPIADKGRRDRTEELRNYLLSLNLEDPQRIDK